MNIGNIPRRNAIAFPNKVALIFENQRWTWKELNCRINRLSNSLLGLGLSKGDKIAILTENVPAIVETNYACAKAGLVYFPVMARLFPEDIKYLVDLSDAAVLIYHPDFLKIAELIRAENKKVKSYIQIGGKTPDWAILFENFISTSKESDPEVEVFPDDIYCLLNTGGTTGIPKLAMLSHLNSLCAIYTTINSYGICSDDTGLQVMPLYHVIQNTCLNPLLAAGASVVLQQRFEPVNFMRAIYEEKVSIVHIVPPFLFNLVMSQPEASAFDVSHVRVFKTAAATFPDSLKKSILEKMPQAKLIYSYGLTEASSGNVTILRHDNTFNKSGSIGVVNPLLDYRIIDEYGKRVPRGEPGELLMKGPLVIRGYYKREEETRKTIVDGWLHTGDIVKEDNDGFLFFVDRLKDMIKTGGENVFAKEVEDIMLKNSKIAEVVVVGLPDEQWGEKIHAAVVLKQGMVATEAEILAYCRENMAGFKRPKKINFLKALPRNPSGKVLKHVLKQEFLEKKSEV